MNALFRQGDLPKEIIALPSGKVEVQKFSMLFDPWKGEPIKYTYGGKAVLDSNGSPAFAELAIIPVLKQYGFAGAVWVDTFRRCFRDAMPKAKCELPLDLLSLYQRIVAINGGRGGCWDVMGWDSEGVTFVECKRKGRDRMRANGARWLASALKAGLRLEQFVICEWQVTGTLVYHAHRNGSSLNPPRSLL